MKKLIMLAAILALALAAAVPAVAQVAGGVGNEGESGDVALGNEVANEGDYASQCTPAIQFGNTGNFSNASSFVQYDGEADDFEPGGIEVAFEPSQEVSCENTIQQSSAASSN
jgi:hypothetical protein